MWYNSRFLTSKWFSGSWNVLIDDLNITTESHGLNLRTKLKISLTLLIQEADRTFCIQL